MPINPEFRSRIEQLLRVSETNLENRREERRDKMIDWTRNRERFESLARRWMNEEILPRVSVMAEAFPHCVPALLSPDGLRASLCFSRTEEFPVDARAEVAFTCDSETGHAWLLFEASIIPILMPYEREAHLVVDLEAPSVDGLRGFVEDRIARFVADYLRVRDPESVYQRDLRVIDPVCGMQIRRVDAVASSVHEDRTYYFCVERCRDLFERNPDRYVRGAQLGM